MSKAPRSLRLAWDACRKDASYSSNQWAATDRGWHRAHGVTPRMHKALSSQGSVCLGHYLDYETPRHDQPDPTKTVHAVSCVSRQSSYFHTPAEARAWLESQTGNVFAFVIAELRKRGLYEHELQALGSTP